MEFNHLNLGDKRINARAIKIVNSIAESPQSSIPEACQGWAETLATYRFYSNDSFDSSALMQPHYEATEQRIRLSKSKAILCIQDTSELDFNGKQTEGMGRLSYDAQRGMYLHPTFCVTPERLPLGITDSWVWARGLSKEEDKLTPSIKESIRWIEGYERVAEMAERCPDQQLVYVVDREGDMYDLMERAQQLDCPADWLIRARHNRSLPDKKKLWDVVDAQKPLAKITFIKPRKRGEKARKTLQEVKVLRYTLAPKGKTPIEMTLVQAKEINPPKGSHPIVWRLLTNRLVSTEEQACEIIDWYRCRWEIEMFFDVLKVGCKVEKLQLGTKERVEKALAMYMVVTWRVMYLMRLGRNCPELPADLIFDPLEWKSSYLLGKRKLPDGIPSINDVIRNLATLGGFLARKSDGEPGAKSIWKGFQRIQDCIYGIQIARELQDLM
ncbi:MAG: IS4 family transposase [Gammaproteobacteria bacterium]|nr:IS4 family transposase [Gammaproteobacteria bacterium]